MDSNNPVIALCIEGTRLEFSGKREEAAALYWQAWKIAASDYDACIAAHYVARFQDTPEETLCWNQEALRRAEAVDDEGIRGFYPSLYLALGQAYELTGEFKEAMRFYDLAAALGFSHQV